ncbi:MULTISPECIES: hypothetical protein [Clostridium]|uniref:Uncharacterized protein n=1 Tax=Clostridium cibarium TaxID=2762247 RepID=A0ABR8PW33_9CLOT|nr:MULTISPECIES: hypothetical protein [Clostridium]MBD7912403.1 hypothetical protein [Clostridium cibarium]
MIENLKMAISDNNLEKARRILRDELINRNYPGEVFKEALDLAESYNVFEEHNNEEFLPDSKKFTKEYLEKLKEGLDSNFSKERFVKAYYVARRLEKANDFIDEDSYDVRVYDHYKDFFFRAQLGTAVATIAAIGIGVLLYKRHKRK